MEKRFPWGPVIIVGGIALIALTPGLLKSIGKLLGTASGILDDANGIAHWAWKHTPVVWVYDHGATIKKGAEDTGGFIKDKACYVLPFC